MRKNIFFFLVITSIIVACESDDDSNGIYSFGAGYIKYEATIGHDFDSALDSLLMVVPYDQLFNSVPYYIDPEPLDRVNYPTNDRSFYMITVKDSMNGLYLCSPSNVLDTKGDWYKIVWGED
ncbi:MAG: hypothetical protein K5864_07860 [Bacteroidales bacterium]|nr:hypothetical protein [Bacteroidales bacterium]